MGEAAENVTSAAVDNGNLSAGVVKNQTGI